MRKTLIISENNYLVEGLKHLLPKRSGLENVHIVRRLSEVEEINAFDDLIIEVKTFQIGLCFYRLKERKEGSNLYFLQINKGEVDKSRYLSCYKDAYMLTRETKKSEVRTIFRTMSSANRIVIPETQKSPCEDCVFPYLTSSQLLILVGIKNGYSISKVASGLGVSKETIFSQMSKIRRKFQLKSDMDLKEFLTYKLLHNDAICIC